jgi:uncharacterized membrane protein (UPF0127 family)
MHDRTMTANGYRLLAALLLVALLAQAPGAGQALATFDVLLDGRAIQVEIADTPEKRSRGLMYRRSLAPDAGMLFVFPRTQRLTFWMKDTPLALDIGFFDAQGRLLEVRALRPFDTRYVTSSAPARFALETNAGWFEARGIQPGARLTGLPEPFNR